MSDGQWHPGDETPEPARLLFTRRQRRLLDWLRTQPDGCTWSEAKIAGHGPGVVNSLRTRGILVQHTKRGRLQIAAVADKAEADAVETEILATRDALNAAVERAATVGRDVRLRVEDNRVRVALAVTTFKEL